MLGFAAAGARVQLQPLWQTTLMIFRAYSSSSSLGLLQVKKLHQTQESGASWGPITGGVPMSPLTTSFLLSFLELFQNLGPPHVCSQHQRSGEASWFHTIHLTNWPFLCWCSHRWFIGWRNYIKSWADTSSVMVPRTSALPLSSCPQEDGGRRTCP